MSHALSSMYELMHRCIKKKKGKENITLWWWFRWWSDWVKRCYPIKIMWWFTEFTFIDLFSIYIFTVPIWIGSWKILSWNLLPLHGQSWKIITESSWSIPISNKRMWLGGMVVLGSTTIGSGTKLIRENQLWVRDSVLIQELSLNQRIEIYILFPSMECDYPNLVIQFLDL